MTKNVGALHLRFTLFFAVGFCLDPMLQPGICYMVCIPTLERENENGNFRSKSVNYFRVSMKDAGMSAMNIK